MVGEILEMAQDFTEVKYFNLLTDMHIFKRMKLEHPAFSLEGILEFI